MDGDKNIVRSASGIDSAPFARSAGVTRLKLTYADFAVAATEATVKLLEFSGTDRFLLIRDAWVIVRTIASGATGLSLHVGDEDYRDGYLRDVSLATEGLKGRSQAKRGAYLGEGQYPMLGDGVGLFGAAVDPTVTLTATSNLDGLTAGEFDIYFDYVWVDTTDAGHPTNPRISKASDSVPPALAYTPRFEWKRVTLSHDTAAIPHDGTGYEDITFDVGAPFFFLESYELVKTAGTDEKELLLYWFIESTRTLTHPATTPALNGWFTFDGDSVDAGEQRAYLPGCEWSEADEGRVYMKLVDPNTNGGSGTYKLLMTFRVPTWVFD